MAIAAARNQDETRPLRRLTRRTRYRDWADYGPPPVMPLWSTDLSQKVDDALLQRRMSPTQNSVVQYMQKLTGTRGWCVFSTKHWMEKLHLARTQLLRARRELIEQHIVYYREFPTEPDPPYIDQPGCGWIGFYPPAEWHPRTKAIWGGARDHAGRKKQADCNNLISSQTTQADCNNLIFLPSNSTQDDTGSLLFPFQTDTDGLLGGGSLSAPGTTNLFRSGTNNINPISDDIGTACAAPGANEQEAKTIGDALIALPSLDADQIRMQPYHHANDVRMPLRTDEFQEASTHNSPEKEAVASEELAAWRKELAEAKEEERHAWRTFDDAQKALDAVGHSPLSGRDRLVRLRYEASQVYHFTRDRREAFALIIRLAESGIPRREAIERALEQYPHLRKEPETDKPDEASVPEQDAASLEAWPLLTKEQWNRALFGRFCALWGWPTRQLNEDARGRLNRAVRILREARLRPEYVSQFFTWWKWRYPWRQNPMPWDLTASIDDFYTWQEQNQAWSTLPEATDGDGNTFDAAAETAEQAELNTHHPPDSSDASPEDLVDDLSWVAQLCRFVPDAERAHGDRQKRSVRMLWGFVRDELRPGLNTARRQHLDALVPAWNPANPRELVLLGSTRYTITFINSTLLRDINPLIEKLLRKFFDCARPVYVSPEVIEQLMQGWNQEASL